VIIARRLVFVILISSLLVALTFVQKSNLSTVKASPDIHQGNLILSDNDVYVIENQRFDINGSIIVEENATLILRNAILNITHLGGIYLQNPLNGNPRLRAENTIIVKADYNFFYGNSSAVFSNCSASGHYFLHDETNATILDSTINYLQARESSIASITNSTIENLSIVLYSTNASVVNLFPGFFAFWDFWLNCSVQVNPSGEAPYVTFTQATINKWSFSFQSFKASYQEIINSDIWFLHANGISHISAYNSTFYDIELYSSSVARLVNSTYSTHRLLDNTTIYVSWYLNVDVIDSINQNVPSANITVTYPNGTIAQSKLTDENGWAMLTLMEKIMNVTGEYLISNYIVEATYETYSNSTELIMTGNQIITLKLEGLVIPEFSSFLILPLLMTATLLAIIVFRRKHRLDNFAVHLSEMSNPSM
jgi:hypothetical protein